MDTPPKKEKKFPQNKIYRKNIKARGQKLYISKNFNKKKESAIKNKSIINKYKNYNTKENSLTLITCIKNKPDLRLCIKAIEK